jgi:hypothetical protein
MAKASPAEDTNGMATRLSLLRVNTLEEKGRVTAAGAGDEWLRSQLVGKDVEFDTPFGRRVLTYADQTASGRSLRYIEDYIVNEVLPFYGEHARTRVAILAYKSNTSFLANKNTKQFHDTYVVPSMTCVQGTRTRRTATSGARRRVWCTRRRAT